MVKTVVTKKGYPALPCWVLFGDVENICKSIVTGNNLKRVSIEVLMEFLSHTPFKRKKLKFASRIVSVLGLQTSASISIPS